MQTVLDQGLKETSSTDDAWKNNFLRKKHKGFLLKRTFRDGKSNKWHWFQGRWKRKWFVLSSHYLRYYKVKKMFHGGFHASLIDLKGVIDLKRVTIETPVGINFMLVMNTETMELRAETNDEALAWYTEIVQAQEAGK